MSTPGTWIGAEVASAGFGAAVGADGNGTVAIAGAGAGADVGAGFDAGSPIGAAGTGVGSGFSGPSGGRLNGGTAGGAGTFGAGGGGGGTGTLIGAMPVVGLAAGCSTRTGVIGTSWPPPPGSEVASGPGLLPPPLAGGAMGVGVPIAAGDGDAATGDGAGRIGGVVVAPGLHATSNTVAAAQIGFER